MKRVTHCHALIVCAGVALTLMAAPALGQRLGTSAVPLNTNTKSQSQSTILTNQTFTVPSSVLAKDAVGNRPRPFNTTGHPTTGSSNPLKTNFRALTTPMPTQSQSTILTNQTFTVPSSVLAKNAVGNKPQPINTTGKVHPIKTTGMVKPIQTAGSSNALKTNFSALTTPMPKKPALTATQPGLKVSRGGRISRY